MNELATTPRKENDTKKNREAITLKILLIGVLIIVLLIPMLMIQGLIDERENTARLAMNEVQQKWSGAQMIVGPVITLNYTYQDEKGIDRVEYVNYFPEQLDITGNVETQELKRGLYEIVVYNSSLVIKGKFLSKDLLSANITGNIKWHDQAVLNLGISDLRGISEQVSLTWNDQKYNFEPGVNPGCVVSSGVSISISSKELFIPGASMDFTIQLETKGSKTMLFAPVGRNTSVQLTSNCQTPSFTGAFLPMEREVTPHGFSCDWKVLEINRNYSQVLIGRPAYPAYYGNDPDGYDEIPESVMSNGLNKFVSKPLALSAFGVDLLFPVDHYQKSMRSAKYAFLIIILTFVVCFFVEIVQKKNIYPLQYLLVGLALCLFYTLLVSTSEHIHFTWAYIISALATTTLITLYMIGILKIMKTAFTIGALLVGLYSYIFFLIQLETFALLAGSIGLFVILAVIMYFSQKINWNNN